MAGSTELGTDDTERPIAIVGMGCRFPGGADSVSSFWQLLSEGREAVSEVPEERWRAYVESGSEQAAALRRTTRFGAFLDDVVGFDAEFFGVAPREAELMDPQQRILVEVAWEALEHAGIAPGSIAGSDAGVFVGVGSDDYGRRLLEDLPRIEAWTGIGAAMCAVANRISHLFDLRGPSMAVDTACSASLVALHLACQALRTGETSLALAGGVNIMAGPSLTMVLDAAGAISADGRSKAFSASADGYGRGEGAGVVVLKRLGDAQRDGDQVWAVIRGSAVRQDGRTNGIMAPSSTAQAHLLRAAYQAAGISPSTVDYVEAHGTGTRMGDPIEARALAAVVGDGRSGDRSCLIGSVKSNIGHLEAGSGVAGVIKAVLAMRHGEIPASLNVTELNPEIPWHTSGLRVVTERRPWPAGSGPRRAGVSGYGYGGTIAHVVLEQAPATPVAPVTGAGTGAPWLFPVTAATTAGLRANAQRLAVALRGGPVAPLTAIGHTLSARRSHLGRRAAIVAGDGAQLLARLESLAGGDEATGVVTGTALDSAESGVVWVFSGHGSQWVGMGRQLLTSEPRFGEVLDEIGPIFAAEIGVTPRVMLSEESLDAVELIQPTIFAVQVGLAAVWREYGVEPSAVVGHSVGEIAAAVVAGALSLPDAARLVCRRSMLLQRVAGRGAMAMVDLPFAVVSRQVDGRPDVTAAISAGPTSTVVAGDVPAVAEVSEKWRAESRVVRQVASDVAFHSPHMDPLLTELVDAASDIAPVPATRTLYSTALPDPRSAAPRDGAYWAANLRNPVRFTEAIQAAVADGHRTFVEVSGHPVVAHSIMETLAELGVTDGLVIGTLRRGVPDREALLSSLGELYCRGVAVRFTTLFPDRELAELPATAWQHRRFWRDAVAAPVAAPRGHDVATHTLLGGLTTTAGSTPLWLWQTTLDQTCRPYPGNHPVQGVEIVPAAVLLATFLAAAGVAEAGAGQELGLRDVLLRVPVAAAEERDVQVTVQDGAVRLATRLRAGADPALDEGWLTHTTATAAGVSPLTGQVDHDQFRRQCPEQLRPAWVEERLASVGVAAMGFPWRIEELRRDDGARLFAAVTSGDEEPSSWAPVLDAALSAASVVFAGPPILRMPAAIASAQVGGVPPRRAVVTARVVAGSAAPDTVDVTISDADGAVVAVLRGLRYGVLDGDPAATTSPWRLLHELVWRPWQPEPDPAAVPAALVLGGDATLRRTVTRNLSAAGVAVHLGTGVESLVEELAALPPASAVLVLPADAAPEEPLGAVAARSAWLLAETARLLARTGAGGRHRVWAITAGVRGGATAATLGHAPLWGLGRVIAGEHPEIWGGLVDLDPAVPVATGTLRGVLATAAVPDGVAVSGETVQCTRLVPTERRPARAATGTRCRVDGTYLITGGLGALGLEVARWLAGRGARRIVLAGRRGLPERQRWDSVTAEAERERVAAVRALEAQGVTVTTLAVDVADAGQLRSALRGVAEDHPPIRGVVHAAGVLDNRLLADLDEPSLAAVMRPKVDGALALHELFPPGSLDFLVLFSSCGFLLGLPGQASYAAANAVLDALATHRRACGGTETTSFGWTSWRGLGMSTSSALIDVELHARGTADITVTEAFRAWELAERFDAAYLAVLRMIPMPPGLTRQPLLAEITVGDDAAGTEDTGARWDALDPAELREQLAAEVRKQVAGEIRLAPEDLPEHSPLAELGVDSVMTLLIRRRLERNFGLSLPATLLWNHPTIAAVTEYLATRLAGTAADTDPAQVPA